MSVSHINSHGVGRVRKSSAILLRAVEIFGPHSSARTESSGVLPSIAIVSSDVANSARTTPGWQKPMMAWSRRAERGTYGRLSRARLAIELRALHDPEALDGREVSPDAPEHEPTSLAGRQDATSALDERLVDHRDTNAVHDDVLREVAVDRFERRR